MACMAITPAQAGMVLTSDGVADGFSLSLFADGYSSTGYCCGPLGIAVNSDGNVMVQSWGDGTIKLFSNVDGQSAASPLSSVPFATCCYGSAFTNDGGTVYATRASDQAIVQLNNDGTVNQVIVTGPGERRHLDGSDKWPPYIGRLWSDPRYRSRSEDDARHRQCGRRRDLRVTGWANRLWSRGRLHPWMEHRIRSSGFPVGVHRLPRWNRRDPRL